MRRRVVGIVLAAALFSGAMPQAAALDTSASAAVLMDAGSGRVLYEHNAHDQRLIASITKLMTALVALESGHGLDEEVTVLPQWVGVEGSSIYLREGEILTLETLLYGMLLRSGNDAALAVAEHCAGSEQAFVSWMNNKAQALGMIDSHFENPNGLNAEGHFSSAYDMALLARACLENETLRQMVGTKSIAIGTRSFANHNKLLWRYEGCIGLKTGYTEKAGRTLVSAAQRDGLTLICVTLNDPDDWVDHTKLFDYGFSNYRGERVVSQGEHVGQLPTEGGLIPACPVVAGEELTVALTQGEALELELVPKQAVLSAPVSQGQQVGTLICWLNGSELARIPLEAGCSVECIQVERSGFLARFFGRWTER